jgi:hypothetical protein
VTGQELNSFHLRFEHRVVVAEGARKDSEVVGAAVVPVAVRLIYKNRQAQLKIK